MSTQIMTSFGSKLLDTILIGLGIAIALASGIILNSETLLSHIIQVQAVKEKDVIGAAIFTSNDVRRRTRGSLSWFQLKKKQNIYNRDTIYTGLRSGAEITLKMGKETYDFKVADNTLVQLVNIDGDTLIDLQLGSINSDLKKGQKLKIKLGQSTSEISAKSEGGTVQIVKLNDSKSSISASEGELTVTNQGKETSIDKDSQLEVKDNNLKLIEPKIKLVTPRASSLFTLHPENSIDFSWQPEIDIESFRFLLAKDVLFEDIVITKAISASSYSLFKNLDSGSYFWKVQSSKDKNITSMASPVEIINPSQLVGIYPPDQFKINTENKGTEVQFLWETLPNLSDYEIQISTNKDFTEIQQKVTSTLGNQKVTIPDFGVYYWRVSAQIKSVADPISSKPFMLTIHNPNAPAAAPLEPSLPELPEVAEPITPEPKPIEVDKIVNKKTDPFANASLELTPLKDILRKIEPSQKDLNQKYKISWKGKPNNKKVQVIVSDNPKLSSPQKSTSNTKEAIVNLEKPSKYYVKIQYLQDNGKPVVKTAQSGEFEYKYKYVFRRPAPSQPSNNLKLIAFGKKNVSIFFEWRAPKYFDNYTFQIASDETFKDIIHQEVTTEKSAYFNKEIKSKTLFWRVKGHYKDLKSSWSKYRSISISSSE